MVKTDAEVFPFQNRGTLSDKELAIIQKYIKNNYLTMFEMWSQYSEHGFFGENK